MVTLGSTPPGRNVSSSDCQDGGNQSFATALQKTSGDVTETTSMFYKVYGVWYGMVCHHKTEPPSCFRVLEFATDSG